MEINKIHEMNCLEGLKLLADNSIDCCVTSPPYYGLRDYGNPDQIGLEETPEQFTEKITQVFAEVRRVLKPAGTLWLNLGDTYAAYWGQKYGVNQSLSGTRINNGSAPPAKKSPNFSKGKRDVNRFGGGNTPAVGEIKPKDLFGIPWMVAFALRSEGWYLRQDIIWYKPNAMPESVSDRCTKSHEYIFLMSKSAQYFYDSEAIKKEVAGSGKANKKSVWTIPTKPFKDAHFATFPENLIIDCIKAGCPEFICNKCGKPREGIIEKEYKVHENWYGDKTEKTKHDRGSAGNSYKEIISSKQVGLTDCGCNAGFSPGVVLDPFMGGGTTALVSRKLHRNFIGFEINPDYIKIAETRLSKELGFFI